MTNPFASCMIFQPNHWSYILLLAFAVSASAQRGDEKPGPDGNQGNLARVLQNPAVQREIGLSAAQVTEARAVSMAVLEKHRQEFTQALESENKRDEIRKVFLSVTNETFDGLETILSAKQLQRLKQIELQFFGARALGRPNVIEALKPSDEQQKAFEILGDTYGEKMRLVATDAALSPSEKANKRAVVNAELAKEIANVLNADQRDAWNKLVGSPFRPSP